MSTYRFQPQVSPTVAIHTNRRKTRPGLGIGLSVVVVVLLVVAAIGADTPFERAAFVAFALSMAFFGWYVKELAAAQERGYVRIADTGGLRFTPSRMLSVLPLAIAVTGSAPLALRIVAAAVGEEFGTGRGSIWMVIASGASLIWLGQQVWSLRLPAGLTVSDDGVLGVRGAGAINCAWQDVAGFFIMQTATGDALVIESPVRSFRPIPAGPIGSDPAAVASILEHLRLYPADRARLVSGRDAIRAVEAVHASQTD